jgi:hypothetical protein
VPEVFRVLEGSLLHECSQGHNRRHTTSRTKYLGGREVGLFNTGGIGDKQIQDSRTVRHMDFMLEGSEKCTKMTFAQQPLMVTQSMLHAIAYHSKSLYRGHENGTENTSRTYNFDQK